MVCQHHTANDRVSILTYIYLILQLMLFPVDFVFYPESHPQNFLVVRALFPIKPSPACFDVFTNKNSKHSMPQ